jgi:hypothetical protein
MAAARNLIDLATMVGRLQATNLRYPRSLVERLLAEDAKRKSGDSSSNRPGGGNT